MKKVIFACFLLLLINTIKAQPCFETTNNSIPISYGSDASVTGDFNFDGKPDLAILQISGPNTSTISILLAIGNGSFAAAINYTIGTPVKQIITGDFNNDGNTDIASSNIDVLLGNGAGGFSFAAPTNTANANNTGITSADFNNDGKTDIAVTTTSLNKVWVFLGNGSGLFAIGTSYNAGTNPISITTNDFNSDGKIDLAIANLSSGNVSILRNTGTSFAAAVNYYVSSNLLSIASDDFNSDGNPDLAVSSSTGLYFGRVWILFGSSTGTFSSANSNIVGEDPYYLILTDLNNDGVKDIVTENHSSSIISVLMGSINGVFSNLVQYPVPMGGLSSSISCADFDSDGKKDLALGTTSSSSIFIISGNGNGTFVSPISYWAGGQSPKVMSSADFNNDTYLDLAVANNYNDISVLMGTGNGTFSTAVNYTVGSNPSDIVTADFNNDGKMDLAIANSNSNNISILIGNGLGSFLPATNYGIGISPYSLCAKDFNGDNKADLVVGINSQDIKVLLGTGTGTFLSAVNYFFGNYNPKIVSADFNGDGHLDLAATGSNVGVDDIILSFGNGSGAFLTTTSFTINGSLSTLITEDFNNDGKYDLAATYSSSFDTYVFLGNGNGSFAPETIYPSIGFIKSIVSSDFDGDGSLDIAVGNTSTGSSIYLGNGFGSFSAAINYSVTNIAQLAADFNNDGNIDLAGVDGTYHINVMLTNGTSNFTLSPTNTICVGSSALITATGGSNNYTWSTGGTGNSITVNPTTTTTYTAINTSLSGCASSKTISIIVDNTCQDVWPGDANSDGLADNLDVLELGLHYTQTGPARSTTSNNWQSYFSNNWVGTLSNGKNVNHSDCNGDGIISNNDTLAIYNNYNLTHTFKTAETNTISSQLSIVPDQTIVDKGKWGTASIYLGDNANPINTINGLAYTINFNNTIIEVDSIYIEYLTSFINPINQNLNFKKRIFPNGVIYTATTHTNSIDVSGNGKIATIHFKIDPTLPAVQVLNINLTGGFKSTSAGIITPLTTGSGSLTANSNVVSVSELSNNYYTISTNPNPSDGLVTINSNIELQKIELMSITGQVLLNELPSNNKHTLHLESYSNGIYFVNIYHNNKIVKREKIIVNK